MLLITERRQIGMICGHIVYAVSKSEMIPLPNPDVRPHMTYSMNENRSLVHPRFTFIKSIVLLVENLDMNYKTGVPFSSQEIVAFSL